MKQNILHKLGVYELMQILHELHKMGYQKLRWLSYMAPSGMNLRCHITTQDHIYAHMGICFDDDHEEVWSTSMQVLRTGEDIKPFIPVFMKENPRLLEIGRGEDSEYVEWFDKLLSLASCNGAPNFYDEYWALPEGYIRVGQVIMSTPPTKMRLISWNIDGIMAHSEALKKLVKDYSPEIICLQKIKVSKDAPKFYIEGYESEYDFVSHAGVAIYVKKCIRHNFHKLHYPEMTGHILKTDIFYPAFTLYNVYAPYSNPNIEGAIDHRKKFDERLKKLVSTTPDRQIVCGDMNVVLSKYDCWDGKYQRKQANFHDWERQNFLELLKTGHLFDTYNEFHPYLKGFTYFFRNDPQVRAQNHGHRIDYFLASRSFEPQIVKSEIIKDYTVSTNDPILLEIKY